MRDYPSPVLYTGYVYNSLKFAINHCRGVYLQGIIMHSSRGALEGTQYVVLGPWGPQTFTKIKARGVGAI